MLVPEALSGETLPVGGLFKVGETGSEIREACKRTVTDRQRSRTAPTRTRGPYLAVIAAASASNGPGK
jgi:hypothetical protein